MIIVVIIVIVILIVIIIEITIVIIVIMIGKILKVVCSFRDAGVRVISCEACARVGGTD